MVAYQVFGFPVTSERPFPGAWVEASSDSGAPTAVVDSPLPVLPAALEPGWEGSVDGQTLTVERGGDGEHWFRLDGEPRFLLSADCLRLSAPGLSEEAGTRWWRALLDSALFTVGLLRGREAIHAAAVSTPAGVVAIMGPSGAGKSTLLSELLRRGHRLLTDDILFLEPGGSGVTGWPGAPLLTLPAERAAGLGEVIGEVDSEVWLSVPVATGPARLRRLILLERRPGGRPGTNPIAHPLAALMGHLLNFPRGPERERKRFSLAGALSAHVEVVGVEGSLETSPPELAALALKGLD